MMFERVLFPDRLMNYEMVDAFLLSYQLSMLSRYFPDLWLACLDSHSKAARSLRSNEARMRDCPSGKRI